MLHVFHWCLRYFHLLKLTQFCSTLTARKEQASCLDLFLLMISMKKLLPSLWHDCQNTHLNKCETALKVIDIPWWKRKGLEKKKKTHLSIHKLTQTVYYYLHSCFLPFFLLSFLSFFPSLFLLLAFLFFFPSFYSKTQFKGRSFVSQNSCVTVS